MQIIIIKYIIVKDYTLNYFIFFYFGSSSGLEAVHGKGDPSFHLSRATEFTESEDSDSESDFDMDEEAR